MKLAAANGIAEVVTDDDLSEDYVIPSVFNRDVAPAVARAVVEEAKARASPASPTRRAPSRPSATGHGTTRSGRRWRFLGLSFAAGLPGLSVAAGYFGQRSSRARGGSTLRPPRASALGRSARACDAPAFPLPPRMPARSARWP